MPGSSSSRDGKAEGRKARLEQQLKANLRKRKDQARARTDTKAGERGAGAVADEKGES
jgi:hypothetical protein